MPERPPTASLQTPPGRGGIAVVTLAGAGGERLLADLFRPVADDLPADGRARFGHLCDGDETIDEAVLVRRRDAWEINVHGGPAVVRTLLDVLRRRGAEIAERPDPAAAMPVEHPKWHNPAVGRELLHALGEARSPRVAAMLGAQWSAGLSELACSEATAAQLRDAAGRLASVQRLLQPAEVVLAGEPNAGKSTLMNLLVARAVSIVDPRPGATRDWVRELAVLNGLPVWLTDTAGLWQAAEGVDAAAVDRARQCIRDADLVVLLRDATSGAETLGHDPAWLSGIDVLHVRSKIDAAPPGHAPADADVEVSALTGEGLDTLNRAVLGRLGLGAFDPAAPAAFTWRQHDLLLGAADALDAGHPARPILEELLGG
jgi:tRNA modification GTPase